jgi:hypothetical protein
MPRQTVAWKDELSRRVYERLANIAGDGIAESFAAAYEVIESPPRNAAQQLGHSAREVEGGLIDVLLAYVPESERARLIALGKQKAKGAHKAKVIAILEALELAADPTAGLWIEFVESKKRKGWHAYAHRNDLGSPRGLDEEILQNWRDFVRVLDTVLDVAERRFVNPVRELELLRNIRRPSRKQGDYIKEHVAPNSSLTRYFLDGLAGEWLPCLRRIRFFSSPPVPVATGPSRTTYSTWPQGRYLADVAHDHPNEVLKAIRTVPDTENFLVHVYFLEAALQMPAQIAAEVARHESRWLEHRTTLDHLIPEYCGKLVAELANEGECSEAVALARTVLRFVPAARQNALDSETRTCMPEWDYAQTVRLVVPAIERCGPQVAIDLVLDLLVAGQGSDSTLWRSAIEDHQLNVGHDALTSLLTAARALCERASDSPHAARQQIERLERRGHPILQRLAIHLLRPHLSPLRDLVIARATDPALLSSQEVFHELAQLLHDHFGQFQPADQERILGAVRILDDGSEAGGVLKQIWLRVLEGHLPPDLRAEYDAYVAMHGRWPHPTFHGWHEISHGPSPARTPEEISGLSTDELIAFLREWAPRDGQEGIGSERHALASALRVAAEQTPERFAKAAFSFAGLHTAYVNAILDGLARAAKERVDTVLSGDAWPLRRPRFRGHSCYAAIAARLNSDS